MLEQVDNVLNAFSGGKQGTPQPANPGAKDFSENPSAYEGTSWDPIMGGISWNPKTAAVAVDKHGVDIFGVDEYGDPVFPAGIEKFWQFYRWDADKAERWYEKRFGFPLNKAGLSLSQKTLLDIRG